MDINVSENDDLHWINKYVLMVQMKMILLKTYVRGIFHIT